MDNLNKIYFSELIEFNSVLSPTFPVFDELDYVKLSIKQQKAVEAQTLQLHAKEEQTSIQEKIKIYLRCLSSRSGGILKLIYQILIMNMVVMP